jgi:hypothetical protein
MNKIKYFDTIEGQIYLFGKRKYRKIFMEIAVTPKSKNSITEAEEEYFQKNVIDYLNIHKRKAYYSPVVLEIDFYSFQDNPPAIHTLAKCYLDLLENNKLLKYSRRKKLIYKNDRLVKALFINYHIDYNRDNKILVKVDSYSNFCSDLGLISRIENGRFEGYKSNSEIDKWNDSFKYPLNDNDAIEELIDFERNKDSFIAVAGDETYQAWLHMHIKNAQKQYLAGIDLQLNALSILLDDMPQKINEFSVFYESIKKITLNSFFSINLGEVPTVEGENKLFKINVRKKLEDSISKKSKLLFPLSTLLCATIVLVKPDGSGIDLDNLARKIIPFVNEIIEPPSTFISEKDVSALREGEIKDMLRKEILDRPRIPKYSITKYQVFEIPEINGIANGSVLLFLGDGTDYENIWDKIENRIKKWLTFIDT